MHEEKGGGEVKRNAAKDIYSKESKTLSYPIFLSGKISTDFKTKEWQAMHMAAESNHQCATQCHSMSSFEIPALGFFTNQQDKLNIWFFFFQTETFCYILKHTLFSVYDKIYFRPWGFGWCYDRKSCNSKYRMPCQFTESQNAQGWKRYSRSSSSTINPAPP